VSRPEEFAPLASRRTEPETVFPTWASTGFYLLGPRARFDKLKEPVPSRPSCPLVLVLVAVFALLRRISTAFCST
jgi:hypothetical protein